MSHPYISTISGKHYYLLTSNGKLTQDSSPVDINDIAAQLAQINRFTGATSRHYSVAEHSLLCANLAGRYGQPAGVQLACLLHDAHEAYLGDMATPIKVALRYMRHEGFGHSSAWDDLENMHADHVAQQLGIDQCDETAGIVKQIDLIALAHEKPTIGPPDHEPWACLQGITPHSDVIESLLTRSTHYLCRIERAFLDKYHWLKTEVKKA